MTDTSAVQQQVSPGLPHQHVFACESPSGAWAQGATFRVHRPTRREVGEIHVLIAMKYNEAGPLASDVLNTIDGAYRVFEAYLSVILDDAPDCWWTAPANGEKRRVSFDRVYTEDLDAVWKHVDEYLRRFPAARLRLPTLRREDDASTGG